MTKWIFFQRIFSMYAIIVSLSIYGCSQTEEIDERLDQAESLMESQPDSALIILDGVDDSELMGKKIKARYALLKSMALDKNCIDTTTFEVLQPALDYYTKNGTVDEKVRVYYYKGRIYDNAGEDDLAMETYLTAFDNCEGITDSLILARLLVAQGKEFYKQYRIKDFIDNNLLAASVYGVEGKSSQRLLCLKRALSGAIILSDKSKADSICGLCQFLVNENPSLKQSMLKTSLMYVIQFGDDEEVVQALDGIQSQEVAEDIKMNLASAYYKIGESETGLEYLNKVKISPDDILDSLTYWSVKTEILESMGEDREALEAYRNYSRLLERYHDCLFSNELLFSEKKHEMEIENMAQVHKRDNIIKWILAATVLLVLVMLLIYYRYRMNNAARNIAEGNAERLRLETEKLQLERDRLQLEAENLRLEAGQLEDERDRLERLLSRHETLSEEARQVIRERVSMLNGLFAQALTEEESYGKEFRKYVGKIKKDKKRFQKSIGKTMEATHPEFMEYLREHGLTEREIDYVCLYAIGLRGKEIGSYLDLARHYNISSDIRRKLGLESNGSNLGPFIREMMEKEGGV